MEINIKTLILVAMSIFPTGKCISQPLQLSLPVISGLTYDYITQTSVTLYWQTDLPADSKLMWIATDSNEEPLIYTDSLYLSAPVTSHVLSVSNLQPATIYKYRVSSQNGEGMARDSGYFVTRSLSTGSVDVYFAPSDSVSAFLTNLIQTKTTHSLFFSMLKFCSILNSITKFPCLAKKAG